MTSTYYEWQAPSFKSRRGQVYRLREEFGFKYKEIADLLGITTERARQIYLKQCRVNKVKRLKKEGEVLRSINGIFDLINKHGPVATRGLLHMSLKQAVVDYK
jgi:predicted transcriptional regulator